MKHCAHEVMILVRFPDTLKWRKQVLFSWAPLSKMEVKQTNSVVTRWRMYSEINPYFKRVPTIYTKDEHIETWQTNLRHIKSKSIIAFEQSNITSYLLEYRCIIQDRPEYIYAQLLYELIHYTKCHITHWNTLN